MRIDVHRELIQVLKDPERFFVCKRILFDNSIRLQILVRNMLGKAELSTHVGGNSVETLRKVGPSTISICGTTSTLIRIRGRGRIYLEELTGSGLVAATRSLSQSALQAIQS